jgi:hypothetical protein
VLGRTKVTRVVDELTPEGRAAFRRAALVYLESIRRHLGGRLSTRDATVLRRILEGALDRT